MTQLTVQVHVCAPIDDVREKRTMPEHIMKRNHASDDWHTTAAMNDLRVGGVFSSTMAAKDGSMSFDYAGQYTVVDPMQRIEFTLGEVKEYFVDAGRKVSVIFEELVDGVRVTELFDAERVHSEELQIQGWQAILNNFKVYVESLKG